MFNWFKKESPTPYGGPDFSDTDSKAKAAISNAPGRRPALQSKAGTFALLLLAFSALLVGCATTPRDTAIRAAAVQAFGGDAHLKIHEVMYAGPISGGLSSMGSSEELALAGDLQPGAKQDLDLAVWSDSSAAAASTLLRALRYPGVQKLPYLRLLFVGDAADAGRARAAVEATGAKFYFQQK